MPGNHDDAFIKLLESNASRLKSILEKYKTVNIPSNDLAKLIESQKHISKTIDDVNDIIQPRVTMRVSALLNRDKFGKKFSRKRFYGRDSPYNNKKDKSNSFRIVPPMALKGKAEPAVHTQQTVPSQFLLSSLQLLENIRNLQRLNSQTDMHQKYSLD